jgi:UDP-N-acetyl-2-amino-2-deoxyglucuronate dehydrogenase
MSLTKEKFRIGIVGCGSISDTHAEAVMRTDHGALVSAFSRTGKNLDRFIQKFDIEGYRDYNEFLSQENLDIVVVCTPTGTHLDYGKEAAEAGKHVVVEKPIEINVKRGRKLINYCRGNKVKLAVIYQNRFLDQVVRMKKVLDSGEIGPIFMASGSVKWYRDQEYYAGSSWRGTLDLDGGGAVINQSVHTVDLLQWFTGGVESVQGLRGTFTHKDIEAEDNAVAIFKYKNGAIGVFEASTSIQPPQERRVEIYGEKGTAVLKGDIFQLKLAGDIESEEQPGKSVGADSPLSGMTYANHKYQYDQILKAMLQDDDPPVDGKESLESLAVVEALYMSAEEGRPVRVDELLSKDI